MTQETETTPEQPRTGMLESKFWKTVLVLIAGICVFGGAYLAYVMINLLKLDYALSMVSGLVLFLIGIILFLYLIGKKVL